jgi:hypothetical protein
LAFKISRRATEHRQYKLTGRNFGDLFASGEEAESYRGSETVPGSA